MKNLIRYSALGALMLGSLILPRRVLAAGPDPAALAAHYRKLAAVQQSVIDETLKLKAQNLSRPTDAKAFPDNPVAREDHRYDRMIDAASREKADLERYAQWQQWEADGAGPKVGSMIAAQKALLAEGLRLKAQARRGYVNDKVTPESRYAESDRRYDTQIAAASEELALLQGYTQWHALAAAGDAAQIARLDADQKALIQEHTMMKARNDAAYRNGKVTPGGRYAAMDRHCDRLIAAAGQELSVLKEFARN